MKYLILSITALGALTLSAVDTVSYASSEDPLVAALEICIQGGARVKDLEPYQDPLCNLPLHRIAEIQASCEQYTQAIDIAYELHNNELLAACVGMMEQQRIQEKSMHLCAELSEFPEGIRKRGFQLSWRMRGSIGPHIQKVQSHIVELSTNAEVDGYVVRENSRIGAIQEWLSVAKIAAENKKRNDELCEEIKNIYLQQVGDQNPK